MKNLICAMVAMAAIASTSAQQSTFNQNSSRSNNAKLAIPSSDWSFGLTTGASFGLKNNEKNLFRGNSVATKFTGGYQFGAVGLGFTGGWAPGSISQTGINQFLTDRKLQQGQVQVSTSNPFNSYFLLGPNFKLGNKVSLLGQLHGGFFLNNPGAVNILQNGVTRPVYRFEGGSKNFAPGLSTSLQLAYPINKSTRFLINTDYLYSSSTIRVLDPGIGIDVPTEQKRNLQLFTAGVGIVKLLSSRDHASGMATGKRGRESGSGMATGRRNSVAAPREEQTGQSTGRILPVSPASVSDIISPRDHASGLPTGKRSNITIDEGGVHRTNQSCGPVTQKITYPDGSSEEMTFSCPDDAAAFRSINGINNSMPNRISMNVTVPKQTQGATFGEKVNAGLHAAGSAISQGANAPKQTQGATFGEKVNAGLHAAGSALSQGASLMVISGNISWNSADGGTGIVTNNSVSSVSKTKGLSGGGSGAAAASYAATGFVINNGNSGNGIVTTLYARETGSGMATGKRGRETGSGMATGRRQYQPIFNEGNGGSSVCNPCVAAVTVNPLFQGNNNTGSNPLNKDKKQTTETDNDCGGLVGMLVYLMDIDSRSILAQTTTTACGDFWFANVPQGNYIVKVAGEVVAKKQYDIVLGNEGGAKDVAGAILASADNWTLRINSSSTGAASRINTSRSNIKSIVVIAGDTDGDGTFEALRANATFSDGSTSDITSKCIINTSRSNIKQITIPFDGGSTNPTNKTVNTSRSNIKHASISIGDLDGDGTTKFNASTTLNDGSTKDISNNTAIIAHSNVVQFQINTEDSDGDGHTDLIWSPRSNVNDASASSRKGWDGTVKGLSASTADLDGDGSPEIIIGNTIESKNGALAQGASLLGGALPGGAVISAMVAGGPIGGIIVKGGKNPGGQMRTTSTNEFGEFEFTGWEAGSYKIEASQTIYINDETIVTAIDEEEDGAASRKGWDGTVKGGTRTTQSATFGEKVNAGITNDNNSNTVRAQNNNTVRSNRTDQHFIEFDEDGDGSFESSIINFNSEVGSFSIGEPGMPKDKKKATSGIKDTIKTQVRKSNSGNSGNAIPIKWMAPEVLRQTTHVSGDPHVDQKDGTRLIFGNNEADAIDKSNWRSKEVTVKPIRCADGTCSIITAKPEDFSSTSQKKIADIIATPIQNAEVLLVSDNGTVYKRTTDQNGIISLNGLPPGVPIRMLLNVTVPGDEDIIVTYTTDAQGSSISNVLKTKHDTAKNSVGNIR